MGTVGRGGYQQSSGPPDQVLGRQFMNWQFGRELLTFAAEMGTFLHACEGEIVCESINTKIPYFNAPIYLQNKVRYPFSTSTTESK
jgi:H/ACA ribonucleoprotein complex subunit 1